MICHRILNILLLFSLIYQTLAHVYFQIFCITNQVSYRLSFTTRRADSHTYFWVLFQNCLHFYQVFGYKSKRNRNSYWLLYSLNYNGNWIKKNISGCQFRINGSTKTWLFKAEPRWLQGALVFTEVCKAAACHSLSVPISVSSHRLPTGEHKPHWTLSPLPGFCIFPADPSGKVFPYLFP